MGAGVAGLALALGLQRRGAGCLVLERSRSASARGFGFLLMANGAEALRRLDLPPESSGIGQPIERVQLLDHSGELLAEHPLSDCWAISRRRLLATLQEQLQPGTICHGLQVAGFDWQGERLGELRLHSPEGRPLAPLSADVFVGADGMHSTCRQQVVPRLMHRPARVREIVAAGRAPELVEQLGNTFWKVMDRQGGRAVGLVPLGAGRLVWFVQYDCERFPSPQPWRSLSFLQELLADFPALVWRAIGACDSTPYLWHPIDADPPSRLVRANLALVGDAAHPLLPFTSQGVNTALGDAELLVEILLDGAGGGGHAAVVAALQAYERRRVPELPAYVQAGRELAAAFVAPGQDPALPLVL